jgi:hypothetical protein
MLKYIYAHPIPNITIMTLIAYSWKSDKDIEDYTYNVYILNEMKRIKKSKLGK